MPTKTTAKKTRKPTQLDRNMGDLHLRLQSMERQAKVIHEDIVAQIEANRTRLIHIESRLPAPEPATFRTSLNEAITPMQALGVALSCVNSKETMYVAQAHAPGILAHIRSMGFDVVAAPKPKEPEPWVPMVGDWVVLVGKGDTDRSGWLEQFYQAIGSILRVDGLSKDTKDAIHATINGEDWDFDFEWLRPATQSEIDAHLEAEAKPIPFGTRVKVKGADSDGIYWYASGDKHHFVCDFVGLLIAPRNGITVIPTEP